MMLRRSGLIVATAFAILGVYFYFYMTTAARVFFDSEPLAASVRDLRTGRPIEGAVVVVIWQIQQPLFHGHDHRTVHTAQATTDNKGQFQIEGWGRKYAGVFWSMSSSSPYAYVMKTG